MTTEHVFPLGISIDDDAIKNAALNRIGTDVELCPVWSCCQRLLLQQDLEPQR